MLDEEKKRQQAAKDRASNKPYATRLSEAKKKAYQQAQLGIQPKQAAQPAASSWYQGSKPTQRETLARIYQVGSEDETKRDSLMKMYEEELANPSSPIYNPYTQATTSRLNKTNLNNTMKAQDEWARLSDELSYWATRTDRNYSDDEIIARIDWDNYKTLQKMDEGRMSGSPLALTEAVGYSEDAMYGVLWAARNPEAATGDAVLDAVQGALGRGVRYQRNEQTASRLDPLSQQYNPYAVSGTMDELSYKYRTDRFDDAWLDENRDLLLDPETAKDYGRIYDAVQNTSAIQAEAEALKAEVATITERGNSVDFEYLLEQKEYPNLRKLQESLKSGQIIDTADVIDFDLPTLKAESEAAYALKQAQMNAGKDLEAANRLAEEEKKGIVEWFGGLFQKDTTPKDAIEYPKPVAEETPEEIINEGAALLGPNVQELAVTEPAAAAEAAQTEYAALIEQNPELLTTDNGQKGAMFMLVLANEAGMLTDPAAQEKAKAIQDTVAASMNVDMDTGESKGLLAWLDEKLQTGGTLVAAQENEGLGLNTTLMVLWDRAMARGADWVENLVGQAVVGVGELIGSEDLVNYGKESMETFDRQVAHYDNVLAENGTPLEILAAQQGSEMLHMMQMGHMSKAISQFNAIKTGGAVNFLTRVLMGTPFALESGGATFQETYSETDNYLTSLAAGTTATAVTSLLSQWDGILKNIETNGMPYLPEVVKKLGSIPGSGVKAGLARYGKAFGMWLMNGLKTVVNESAQEAVEGGATDILVDLIKGENLSGKDWAAFGKDRMAEAVGAVFLTLGSVASTMPTYARSAQVTQSQMRKSNVTIEDVNTFVAAVSADLQDPDIAAEVQERAQNIAVEARTGELIAEGALPPADTTALDSLRETAAEAGSKRDEAYQKLEAAQQHNQDAQARFRANPANPNLANEAKKALDAEAAARAEYETAEREAAKAEESFELARQEAAQAQEAALNAVREQAAAEVAQAQQAIEQAQVEQEAAAEVQRQNDNVLALQADDFVNEYMANAPDDVKDQVRERYMAYDGETQNATRGMVEFASQISKKFNLNITFTDSHGIFEGAYKGGNDIVLDKNATQGEVIQRVLVHEITHAAENSKAYDALADAVLSAYYEGNADQMNADLANIAQQYAEQAGQEGQSVARSELVAQRLSEMLSSNQDAMNRLVEEKPDVATRIWRAIKDFIGKLRGVRDPELDKLMKLEKQLEKALGARRVQKNTTRFELVGYSDLQKADWANSKRIVLYEDDAQAMDFIQNAINDKSFSKKLYFGAVSPELGAYLLEKTGLEVEGYNCTLNSNEVNKVLKKHGNEEQESLSGQRAIIPEDFLKIKTVMETPDDAYLSPDQYNGKPAIIFEKEIDGSRVSVVAVVSDKHLDLRMQTMYAGKQKKNLATPTPAVSSQSPTPEAARGTVPDTSIAPVSTDVNRFSLPSNDILDQRIAQHRNSQLASAPNDIIPGGGEQEQNYGDGERQFAGQTMQNSPVVPDWIKQEFLRPEELNYETDTNREQVERSWQRIQENGYEAERDRLLSLDRYSADDTAEANLMMAMALREDTADPATFMALASHYNKEGTKAGQELQARKLFTRMSPTGARVWAAGQMESNLDEHMRTHQPQRRRIDDAARRVADQIRDMQSGDELLRLNAGGDFTIDESNNRWGVPINEQQQALIDHYGLNNVARPGIFYNRATTQQRMLEAILATPNPLEVTGLGLNLIQRLEYMQDGEAVITNADLNYIGTQLGQFVAQGGDEGGREADLAVSRAYEAYGNITPSTTREKLRTWRYVSMLLSVPSAVRNVIGNASQNVVNATAHGIAVELDKAIARATGQRTVEHLNYQERINGWHGFVEETQNTFRDYFVDRSVTQRGNAKYNTSQRGRVYQTQFIETMRNMEGFLMSFGDRNMWRKAYLNSMAEQQKLADRNLLFNDDGTTRTHEQMLEQAEADANYATFTEDNAVSNVLSQLKNIPGVGEVIDFIMPFTGVPTNITRRMIQYSPIGLTATALRHGYRAATHQNFDQRAFVDGISRGLTGTAMFGVGMLLAAAGVIKPGTGDEDDDKKYGLMTAMGGQYTPYVYNPLTDEYVSLAAFAPAASPLTMGLAAYEEFRDNEDWLQVLINASFSGADQIFDASYMSGVQDIFKGYGSPAENIATTVFSNAVSQSVPALLTQLSNTIDPYVRDTKDKNAIVQALKSGLINRVPGLRQMLPEKVDVTGQTVRTKEGLRNFYDPFTTTDAREDPAVDELFRLSEALGSSSMLPSDALSGSKMTLTVNKQKVTVDGKGKETYRKRYGELWLEGGTTIDKKGRPVVVEGVRSLINSSAYQMMDDEERADAIADILSEAKTGAAMEALNKYGAD